MDANELNGEMDSPGALPQSGSEQNGSDSDLAASAAILRAATSEEKVPGVEKSLNLTSREERVLCARLDLLDAAALYVARSPLGKTAAHAAFCRRYNARDLVLGRYGLPEGIYDLVPKLSGRTLRRWQATLNEEGSRALKPRWGRRSERAYEGHLGRHPEQAAFVRALFLQHGPKITARQIQFLLAERFAAENPSAEDPLAEDRLAEGQPAFRSRVLPGIRTIQRFKRRFIQENPQLADYLHNPDAWKGRHLTAVGAAGEDVTRLAQVWEIDGTKADVLLRCEDARGTECLKRFSVLAAYEVYSRLPCVLLVPAESAYGALLLLRKAFLLWRRFPETVRIDQGAAFRSRVFRRMMRRLQIGLDPLPPTTPERKPYVERFFQAFNTDLLPLVPGYAGRDLGERNAVRARRRVQGQQRKKDAVELAMTAEEFQQFCDAYCRNYSTRRVHEGIGCVPAQRVADWNALGVPVRGIPAERLPAYRQAFARLLPPAPRRGRLGEGVRTVRKGTVRLGGRRYWAPELAGAWNGRRVVVRYDPADLGRVAVFAPGGGLVCEAEDPDGPCGVGPETAARVARRAQKRFMDEALARLRHEAKTLLSGPRLAGDMRLGSDGRRLAFREWTLLQEPGAWETGGGVAPGSLAAEETLAAIFVEEHLPEALRGALDAALARSAAAHERECAAHERECAAHENAWSKNTRNRGGVQWADKDEEAFDAPAENGTPEDAVPRSLTPRSLVPKGLGRPGIWESDFERYQWCLACAGKEEDALTDQDAAFLAQFERQLGLG